MEKPHVKYRTMKCPFVDIIKNKKNICKIFDTVQRTHKLVIHTYQFLRLWILDYYHHNKQLPTIDENTIRMCFKVLLLDSRGPKPKGTNLLLLNEFEQFYKNEYSKLEYDNKIDGNNLSQILGYCATDMLTNIENNIKQNFVKYVKRFVNSSFKKSINEQLNKTKNKKELEKQLYEELYEIKQDLLNETLKSKEKYHEWINKHKNNIFPKSYEKLHMSDIRLNPQNYIKCMIYMCLELEKIEVKSFQFFPLRTDIAPKYISIDTKSIIEILVDSNKNEYLGNIEKYKKILWNKYFKLNDPIFQQKNYSFNYMISTDCFATSIQLINNNAIEKDNQKKQNMKHKKVEMMEICKGLTQQEKEEHKLKLKQQQKELQREKIKKMKEQYKLLPKEEQQKIKDKYKKKEYIEFPYLEELNEEQFNKLKNSTRIVCDCGKRSLLFMLDNKGNKFNYTNKQYIHETKRLKYQRLLQNYKNKNNIDTIENKLTDYNSKSCTYETFKTFIRNKNKINEQLFKKYENQIFRKYKWYSFINKKKTISKLVKNIKNIFGNNSIYCFGDWSIGMDKRGEQMKYMISTPNITLQRQLSEHLTIYTIDEFRTSMLHYKTEQKTDNLCVPDKKGIMRNLHSVLTCQMENKRIGCINRDENAVKNMQKIVNCFIKDKSRPIKFRRNFDLDKNQIIKDDNPKTGFGHMKPNIGVKCHQARKGAIRV